MKYPYTLILAPLVILGLTLGLCSCVNWVDLLSREMNLHLILEEIDPELQLTFPGCRLSWNIRWYDGQGRREEVVTQGNEAFIVLEKDVFTPIIAVPRITLPLEGGDVLLPEDCVPPRGSVYPLLRGIGDGTGMVYLDALGGIGAECAEAVLLRATEGFETGRRIAEAFNWFRFQYLLGELDRPLRLDKEALLTYLLNGTMRTSYIRELRASEFTVVLPEQVPVTEILSSLNPATENIPPLPGQVRLVSLTRGLHRWYCQEGILTAQVQSGKLESLFFTSFRLR
jgi:hypothetical protein